MMGVRTWLTAALATAIALAWASAGCSGDETTSGGTTAKTGTGGAAAGGAGGDGGSTTSSTTATGGSGGSGGAGGCMSDDDCGGETPYCDQATGTCGECATDQPESCPAGQYCVPGDLVCEPGCDSDEDCSAGGAPLTCDLETHACVGCKGDDASCPAGQICDGETCVDGCTQDHACQDGYECCDGSCYDTSNDVAHCGSCDPCKLGPNATVACESGACIVESCSEGFEDCNDDPSDGCEANLAGSAFTCGTCDNVCDLDDAQAKCVAGACAIAVCDVGHGDCNGDPSDGCEAALADDIANCGSCGSQCDDPPGAKAACKSGKCTFGKCGPGKFDCNDDPADGCETSLGTDPQNCGACGNACPDIPGGQVACTGGVCGIGGCLAGLADCDGSVFSGCEADLSIDEANCGACGIACAPVPNGAPGCVAGTCGVGPCDAGKADCDGDAANGCEAALATDAKNCGACGDACPNVPGGQSACVNFACALGKCDPGKADCFGGLADGCETTLATDVDHCGGCGQQCPLVPNGDRACKNGQCAVAGCDAGFADCDKQVGNGCESPTSDDPQNCGGCGAACPAPNNATATCEGGVCGLGQCQPGFADCDGKPANGCEFDTTKDPKNCGGCGVVCGSGTCQAGKCVCTKTVLLLPDDGVQGSSALAASLTAAGFAVTTSPVPSYQYSGSNPAPAGFGAVVLLSGGPGSTSYKTDMPALGQNALVSFVNAGNGLVMTEWAAYQVAEGRWQTLEPFVLLQRNASFIGQVTYQVDDAFAAHPLWSGLPASFTFASPSNVGNTKIAQGVTRFAGSPEAIDAAALRDVPNEGRVVHVSHAGNYSPNGWSNTNVQKLIVNAVSWSARCN